MKDIVTTAPASHHARNTDPDSGEPKDAFDRVDDEIRQKVADLGTPFDRWGFVYRPSEVMVYPTLTVNHSLAAARLTVATFNSLMRATDELELRVVAFGAVKPDPVIASTPGMVPAPAKAFVNAKHFGIACCRFNAEALGDFETRLAETLAIFYSNRAKDAWVNMFLGDVGEGDVYTADTDAGDDRTGAMAGEEEEDDDGEDEDEDGNDATEAATAPFPFAGFPPCTCRRNPCTCLRDRLTPAAAPADPKADRAPAEEEEDGDEAVGTVDGEAVLNSLWNAPLGTVLHLAAKAPGHVILGGVMGGLAEALGKVPAEALTALIDRAQRESSSTATAPDQTKQVPAPYSNGN